MQVSMAVLALIGSICKLEIGVAITACDGGMAPSQGEAGSGMIKFDLALDDLPIRRRVTGCTRQIEAAVRVLRGGKRPDGLGMQDAPAKQKQHRSNN
jgi:hypothetical protein